MKKSINISRVKYAVYYDDEIYIVVMCLSAQFLET